MTETTWTEPDPGFEATVHEAVDLAYDDARLRAAWHQIDELITGPGRVNALGQKLIQLTMPGIPDVYQGTEVWESSLVDPDNRRPVDFATLRGLLAAVQQARPPDRRLRGGQALGDPPGAGRPPRPARAVHRLHPVEADGPQAEHLVGFDRGGAITLATRLPVGLVQSGGWGPTTVELPGQVTDALTGASYAGRTAVADLLSRYPVALLLSD